MSNSSDQEGAVSGAKGPASVPRVTVVTGVKVGPGPLDKHLRDAFTYSIIDTAESKITLLDKRDDERMRTRLRGGLVSNEQNRVITDCLIQDRSRSGARLRLAQDRPLPRRFLLSDEASQSRFWARLVWQKGREAGVKLVAL